MRDGISLLHDISGWIDGVMAKVGAHPAIGGTMFLNRWCQIQVL